MAVNLPANIIIGAKTTSGFDALGGKLMNMGSLISQFSDKVLDFEKDSVEVYKNYETLMLEAEGALTTQYTSATQRARVMEELEGHVSRWAANSIFHTDDMAKAVSEAAHAGWSLEEMVEGIPVAMNLAQAGSLSLSEGLDDLIKTLNATGLGTEGAARLVDQWTMAANSSATTVGELGDALTTMGASARFADSTEELMALLAVLADTGTVGSRAGTMIRNGMLRVVAPTTKAEDAMSLLGADAEELNEVLADKSVTKAVKDLEGLGFSAYDSKGQLKPMIQIFKDMDKAMEGLDEAARNEILAAIFPTRTTTAALAFLDAANGKFDELMESMQDSEGYAGRIAEIQTSGLMGSTELLLSKEEELKRRVGDVLSGPLEKAQGFLGDIIDGLNEMPVEGLTALTGAATALGLAGPGMFIGGLAVKAIAAAGPWGTGFIVAAMGAGALAAYLTKISEIKFESNFGTMELDLEALNKEVDGLKTKYDLEAEALTTWKSALDEAQETYSTLATGFAEKLTTKTLTRKKLTQKEKEELEGYAKDLVNTTMIGIDKARNENLTFLDMLFGDMETDEETGVYQMAFDLENAYFEGLFDDATEIGEQLRKQMVAALEDGELDENERKAIQATVDRLNEINAAISDKLDRQAYEAELHRAGRMSWDSAAEYLSELDEKQNDDIEALNELYDAKFGILKASYDDAVEKEIEFEWGGETYTPNEDNWALIERLFEEERQKALDELYDKYGNYSEALARALLDDSMAVDAWDFLNEANEKGLPDFSTFDWSEIKTEDLENISRQLALLQELSGPLLKLFPKGSKNYEDISDLLDQAGSAQEFAAREVESRELIASQTAGGVDEYGRAGAAYYDRLTDLKKLEEIKNSIEGSISDKGFFTDDEIANWIAINERLDELNGTNFRELPESQLPGWWIDYVSEEKMRTRMEQLMNPASAGSIEFEAAELEEARQRQIARKAELLDPSAVDLSEYDRAIADKRAEIEHLKNEIDAIEANIAEYEPWLQEGGLAGMYRREHAEKMLYGGTDAGGNHFIGSYEALTQRNAELEAAQAELSALTGEVGTAQIPVETTGGPEAMSAAVEDMQSTSEEALVEVGTTGGPEAMSAAVEDMQSASKEALVEVGTTGGPEAMSATVEEMQATSGEVDVPVGTEGSMEALAETMRLMQEEADNAGTVEIPTETTGGPEAMSAAVEDMQSASKEALVEVGTTGGPEAMSATVEEMQAASDEVDVPVGTEGGMEALVETMRLMQEEADKGIRIGLQLYNIGNGIASVGGGVSDKLNRFAEGGRATEPSIFAEGEAAEWAIPEEHTERTRQLLRGAAAASGFGWDDLLSSRGGLNGDAGNVVVNTTYAPTINAGDAAGVEDVLNRDKSRVEKIVREAVRSALADQRLRDEVEVYV